jgi:hypothetical protein
MVDMPVRCPRCHTDQVIKGGRPRPANNAINAKTWTAPSIRFSHIPSHFAHSPGFRGKPMGRRW